MRESDPPGSSGWARRGTAYDLFCEQAGRAPDHVAALGAAGAVSYGRLAAGAAAVAAGLRTVLPRPLDRPVALLAGAEPPLLAGLIGILQAGACVLPLDPRHPDERLAWILADAGCPVVVASAELRGRAEGLGAGRIFCVEEPLPGAAPAAPAREEAEPDALACVVYTSGSTGRPKGVQLAHRGLVPLLLWGIGRFGFGAHTRVLQNLSYAFDFGLFELLTTLLSGGTVVFPGAAAGDPAACARRIVRERIETLHTTPAFAREIALAGEALESLAVLHLGGEALSWDTVDRLRAAAPRAVLYNGYGPTEATVSCSLFQVGAEGAVPPPTVPIGPASVGNRLYLLDPAGDPVAHGEAGDLHAGGPGVARGYLGRPELTAERFVPDPFSGEPGARLYRTGDLVRELPGGDFLFLGRLDRQVKVRGVRVELEEIEAALARLPAVRAAAVLVRPGEDRLTACVVPRDGAAPGLAGALRREIAQSLPAAMVPTAWAFLDALPLTPNGKVDRRALEGVEPSADAAGAGRSARTPTEQVLAGLCAEVLRLDHEPGLDEDFFDLGGHSLLAAQMAARVRQALNVELSVVEIFHRPTIARLAELVEAGGGTALPEIPPIRPVPRDGRPLPLSFPQERVWVLDRLAHGGNRAYNFQVTLTFHGPLRVEVLAGALGEIVRRHEVLRTGFPEVDGRPVQVVHPAAPVELPQIDLEGLPEEEREAEAERLVAEAVGVAFDVARAPLVRWRLVRLREDLHVLIQVEHHFVHDGWSYALLLRELKELYAAFADGRPSPLPEPPVQYADFAVWQRAWLQGETLERLLAFWRRKMERYPAPVEIATDRPRPARAAFRGTVETFRIPPELYETLRRFSRREGRTLYMTMLAGFLAVLERYTGATDLLLGTSNANRRIREIQGMIGMVVNSLLLRADLGGRPAFRALLGRVRELTLELYTWQDMPFERLVQELKPERRPGYNPLFQIMYNFHDAAVPDLEFAGLRVVRRVRSNRTAKVDLNVIVVPRAEQRVGLEASEEDRLAELHWEYNTDLFDLATMQRMAAHYLTLLAGAAADPSLPVAELPLLTLEERQQLAAWGEHREVPGDATLPELFAARAERAPDAAAVTQGEMCLTYGELARRAGRLAQWLRGLGVGPGVPVALCAHRSPELLVGIVGIVAAGGAYVPLDPAYPAERLVWILEDALRGVEQPLLVAEGAAAAVLPAHRARLVPLDGLDGEAAAAPLHCTAGPDDPAYVIYTSGSTGRPKGVPIPHRHVVRLLRATQPWFGFGPQDVWTLFHSFSFDFSVWEIWGALAQGGRLVVVPPEVSRTPEAFFRLLVREQVTVLNQTPSAFLQLAGSLPGGPAEPVALREVIFGGEALETAGLRPWADRYGLRRPRLVNMYGITETTVFVTGRPLEAADLAQGLTARIGRAIPDQAVVLVDGDGNRVPVGVPGELLVGGAGLSPGYLHRPELSAARFVPDPFGAVPGGRLYRSGDLARWRPDGDLEYLGRIDQQVKIRGFRIEPGEIEAALERLPEVQKAVVLAREERGEMRLVAWLVAREGQEPDAAELRRKLKGWLADSMIPAAFVTVPSFPLTANGKLDRAALPAPDVERAGAGSRVAPRTPEETALAGIWTEVLGIGQIGVHDDFFSLGGHSLSVARVVSRVRERLGVDLPLLSVFERSTLEALAAEIAAQAHAPRESGPAPCGGEAELPAHLPDDQLDALLAGLLEERET